MGTKTNSQMVTIAVFISMVTIWLLGYFLPDLMATAPDGLEAGMAGALTIALTFLLPDAEVIKTTPKVQS